MRFFLSDVRAVLSPLIHLHAQPFVAVLANIHGLKGEGNGGLLDAQLKGLALGALLSAQVTDFDD